MWARAVLKVLGTRVEWVVRLTLEKDRHREKVAPGKGAEV